MVASISDRKLKGIGQKVECRRPVKVRYEKVPARFNPLHLLYRNIALEPSKDIHQM